MGLNAMDMLLEANTTADSKGNGDNCGFTSLLSPTSTITVGSSRGRSQDPIGIKYAVGNRSGSRHAQRKQLQVSSCDAR